MEMNHSQALHFLSNHKNILSFPGLNPDYVVADSLRDNSLEPKFFVFQNGSNVFYHAFHTRQIQNSNYREIISAYGYGGPIASTTDETFLEEASNEYKLWCAENNIIVETIRFHPLFKNWCYYHGDAIPKRNTVYVNLQPENILATYLSSARRAIKTALKNEVKIHFVAADEFLNSFPDLYYARMKAINAKEFYFFNLNYFEQISSMYNAHRVLAVYNGEVIGGGIFFIQDKVLEYFLYATNQLGKQFQVTNLILHESFLYAQQQGCHYAHLGGGIDSDIKDPVFVFKYSFGRNMAEYRIGKYIHNHSAYENLISQNLLQVR